MMILTRRAMGASSLALLAGCATRRATTRSAAARAPPRRHRRVRRRSRRARSQREAGRRLLPLRQRHLAAEHADPADRTRWGTFDMLRDKADSDVRADHRGSRARRRRARLEPAEDRRLLQFVPEPGRDRRARASRRAAGARRRSPRCARTKTSIRLIASPGIAVNFADRHVRRRSMSATRTATSST